MGYDLTSETGDYFRFNIHGWGPILDLAKKYGWKPLKTTRRRTKDWSGTYFSNDGQRVVKKDAAAIADALEKSIPFLSDVTRTPHVISYRPSMPRIDDKSEYDSLRRNTSIPDDVPNEDILILKYGHGENEWYPGKDSPAPYVLIVLKDDMEAFDDEEGDAPPEDRWSGPKGIQRVVDFMEFCRKGSFVIR